MTRGRAAALAVAIALVAAPLVAAEDEPSLEIEATAEVASRYVWRGLVLDDEAVLEPSATLAWRGLSFEAWANFDLTDFGSRENEVSEIDLYLDYTRAFGKIELTGGLARYGVPGPGTPTEELYLGVEASLPVTLSLTAWRDVDQADGLYLEASMGKTLREERRVAVDLGASVGWSDSRWAGYNYGVAHAGWTHVEVDVEVPIRLTDHVSLRAFVHLSSVLDGRYSDAVERPDVVQVGVGLDFAR